MMTKITKKIHDPESNPPNHQPKKTATPPETLALSIRSSTNQSPRRKSNTISSKEAKTQKTLLQKKMTKSSSGVKIKWPKNLKFQS